MFFWSYLCGYRVTTIWITPHLPLHKTSIDTSTGTTRSLSTREQLLVCNIGYWTGHALHIPNTWGLFCKAISTLKLQWEKVCWKFIKHSFFAILRLIYSAMMHTIARYILWQDSMIPLHNNHKKYKCILTVQFLRYPLQIWTALTKHKLKKIIIKWETNTQIKKNTAKCSFQQKKKPDIFKKKKKNQVKNIFYPMILANFLEKLFAYI